jgi:hypothetical protein
MGEKEYLLIDIHKAELYKKFSQQRLLNGYPLKVKVIRK